MRLIDADELMKGRGENDNVRIAALCAPTAYDVDKVVKKIEERRKLLQFARIPKSAKIAANNAFLMAIEDIRSGGIE